MSLSKQLILLLTALFFAVFTINFLVSVNNIRSYLQIESQVHAQDTAVSLGLALSPHLSKGSGKMPDTIISAIFDRGYYREIRLVDADGKEILKKTNPKTFEVVPKWFASMLKIETATVQQEISSGWVVAGTIYVTIHPGYGYLKLWQQSMEAFYYSSIAFVVSVALLFLILRLVLIPLERLRQLAARISDGQFDQIKPLPWTSDLKTVAVGMNSMSGKIGQMISNLNTKLEQSSSSIKTDDLTGLRTRSGFDADLKSMFVGKSKGAIFLLRIDDLGGYAQSNGDGRTNQLVTAFAEVIRKSDSYFNNVSVTAYRFYGAEFALIAHDLDPQWINRFCSRLVADFAPLEEEYEKREMAHIGGVSFNQMNTTTGLLGAAFEAYQKSKLIGVNSYFFNPNPENALEISEWYELIPQVIEKRNFDLSMIAVASEGNLGQTAIAEVSSAVKDAEGKPLPIAAFVSIAETSGKIAQFDLAVVEKVIDLIQRDKITHDLAINLSISSIANLGFRSKLFHLMEQHQQFASQIVFAVSAYAAEKGKDVFSSFIPFAHRVGAKVMLKRYETQFISMNELRGYKLDYIRLARDYTDGVDSDAQKLMLVESIKELGDLIDIKILAEGVEADKDYDRLRNIGLYAVSR